MAGSRENRRVVRVTLGAPIKVVIGSLGSQVRYDMQTQNVSNTGLFLDYERPSRFPFNSSTILEVWVEVTPDRVLFFNGKVARTVKNGETTSTGGSGIGIHIVQMDKEMEAAWREFIETSDRIQRESAGHSVSA
jgi:hypothetical protein